MNKKLLMGILGSALVFTAASCYKPSFEYEPVDPGQLQAPSVDRNSEEYRKKYSTLERYDETVKINVGVCQFELEAGVKIGTTPENQTFNKLAKEVVQNDNNNR